MSRFNPSFTEQFEALTPKAVEALGIATVSESILQQGTPAFPSQLNTALGGSARIIDSTYGGSYIASQLAEYCDDVYAHMVGDNLLIKSNDFTDKTPWPAYGYTVELATLGDGTVWNLVTKSDTTSNRGLKQVMTIPAGTLTGFMLQIEIDNTTDTPISSINLNLTNNTRSYENTFRDFTVEAGRRTILRHWVAASAKPTWVEGDTIVFYACINTLHSHAVGSVYIRNAHVSLFSPSGIENYVQTTTAAAVAGSATLTKVVKNDAYYRDVDVIAQSTGRNDAAGGVDKYSHHRTFDKLIYQLLKKSPCVVIGNCPPQQADGAWLGATDPYVSKGYQTLFKRLMAKWNTGIDIFQLFTDLVASGAYTVTDLMADSVHPTNTGVQQLVIKYADAVRNRKSHNYSRPELAGDVRYYKSADTVSGAWVLTALANTLEERLLGGRGIAYVSATQNDYLIYTGITAEQLHLICRVDAAGGAVSVIVDEGTVNEKTIAISCVSAGVTDRTHGHFICDYLPAGTHTVKVKITSSSGNVKILGLVAI